MRALLALALLLAGCTRPPPVEAPTVEGPAEEEPAFEWPPLWPGYVSPRVDGVPVVLVQSQVKVNESGTWRDAPPDHCCHGCDDGFWLVADNRTVAMASGPSRGAPPAGVIEWRRLLPGKIEYVSHDMAPFLPFENRVAAGEATLRAGIDGDGAWANDARVPPGGSVVVTLRNDTYAESFRVAHLGLWVPPPASEVESWCV